MDHPFLREIFDAASLEEAAQRLGTALDLDGPAPLDATQRALDDPRYAKALIAVRKLPSIRDKLLADQGAAPAPSAGALAQKAAESLLKWGKEGMKPAAPWIIKRRLAACNSCDYQAPAPETLVYRGAKVAVGKDAKICTICHCLTNTKAAISTERCPVRAAENPELSRWGETWVPSEEHPKGPW